MGTNAGSMMRAAALIIALAAAAMLAACSSAPTIPPPSEVPLSKEALALLAKKGMQPGSPVFVRVFKEESELEIWKQRDDGHFYHFRTYPICNWSGAIGPKLSTGDRQAPEGFYSITPALMNPNSKYYLSFNLGYPNAFDRSWGRTGDSVMVHGSCRSAGCYAMTDALMEEIYGLTRESLKAGQPSFQLHAYPFRMTEARMAREKSNQWYGFWKTLKQGYDYFEKYRIPPTITVCERRYVVDAIPRSRPDPAGQCPPLARPPVTAFTPLPEPSEVNVASGNKLKGITDPDREPSLAEIKVAKQQQSRSTALPSSADTNAN
ncbi:murein L,D-transpeptidase family protein [Hyphomicrobium sp.]|uniref:murein L,D-transpeptidase family protein n=1 Tax=Hyphomicrobium sp. TaxID=82 RepID=UPI002D7954F6|nr:murein L,D-transpeptidase family protein [Hyphomicrobium sp.]HET6391103.1 murein L,D-transpeptidase family protein [Hyphomicrobium sp.]